MSLPSGRELVIVKDLSELTTNQKAEIMPDLASAVRGRETGAIYLVAANDGQLLATWRDWAEQRGGKQIEVFRRVEALLVQW